MHIIKCCHRGSLSGYIRILLCPQKPTFHHPRNILPEIEKLSIFCEVPQGWRLSFKNDCVTCPIRSAFWNVLEWGPPTPEWYFRIQWRGNGNQDKLNIRLFQKSTALIKQYNRKSFWGIMKLEIRWVLRFRRPQLSSQCVGSCLGMMESKKYFSAGKWNLNAKPLDFTVLSELPDYLKL
jgi:hypothetical protein